MPEKTIMETNAAGILPVTISDAETVAPGLIVTATSQKKPLVPTATIALTFEGRARRLTDVSGHALMELLTWPSEPMAAIVGQKL